VPTSAGAERFPPLAGVGPTRRLLAVFALNDRLVRLGLNRTKLNLAIRRDWRERFLPLSSLILAVFAPPERKSCKRRLPKKGMLLSGDQIVDYALAVSNNMLAPHESRIINLQSKRISRTGISGFVTRSSMAAMAATPISLQGW
jgi:hypothetical protein